MVNKIVKVGNQIVSLGGEIVLDQEKYDQMYPEGLDEFGSPINPASFPL